MVAVAVLVVAVHIDLKLKTHIFKDMSMWSLDQKVWQLHIGAP